MTIKNLYCICGNVAHNTIFNVYKFGKLVSAETFDGTAPRFVESTIRQFDIDAENNVINVYL